MMDKLGVREVCIFALGMAAGGMVREMYQRFDEKGAETFAATTSDGYPTNAPKGVLPTDYYIISTGNRGIQVKDKDGDLIWNMSVLRYAKSDIEYYLGYGDKSNITYRYEHDGVWVDMTDKQKKKVKARKAKAAKRAAKKYKRSWKWW